MKARCEHCGFGHAGPCPRIKAIEYYQNGTVKKIEYNDPWPIISNGGVQTVLPVGWDREIPTRR